MTTIKKHKMDQMTPVERKQAILDGKSVDRIPCVPFMGEFKCRVSGRNIWDFWHDGRVMADIEIETFHRFGHDRLTIGPNTNGLAEALGANVIYTKHNFPMVTENFLKEYTQLSIIEPVNPEKNVRMREFLQAARLLGEEAASIVPVEASVGGVFTIASRLRGTENLLRDLRRNPEEVHRLLRLVTDSQKNYVQEVAPYGVGIALADPVANPELIGPKMYEKFVYPYTKELTDYIYQISGKKGSLHMCGKTYSLWKYFRELCVNEISLDNIIDLERAVKELADAVGIAGNVPPVDVILNGTKEEIYASVAYCASVGKSARQGYVLATGCDIPFHTELEKVDWMMDAVRMYGK